MKHTLQKGAVALLVGGWIGLMAGCVNQPMPEIKDEQSYEEIPKPEKIVAMLDIVLFEEDGREAFIEQYKAHTGIDLIIIQPPHQQYYERVNMALSTGDMPDILESGESYYYQYAMQNIFVDLDPYVSQSEVFKHANQEIVDAKRIKGNLYAFPIESGGGPVTYIRKDWLDRLGLQIPTNWEAFYEMLKMFTYGDPNKNGGQDTVGYTAPGVLGHNYLRDFYQGAVPDFMQKDGKWVDGFLEPEMWGALERLRSGYQDKIIDEDIFTNNTLIVRDKMYNGEVGTVSYWAGLWNVRLQERTQKLDPTAQIVPIPAIQETYYLNRVPTGHSITTAAKNPEGIFKWFIEYMHDPEGGKMLFTHGVEGIHYEQIDGNYVKLPSQSDPNLLFDKSIISPALPVIPWKDPISLDPIIAQSHEIFYKNMRQEILPPASYTYVKVNTGLQSLREEVVSKTMTGEWTIEQGMGIYKERIGEFEIEQILFEMNQ